MRTGEEPGSDDPALCVAQPIDAGLRPIWAVALTGKRDLRRGEVAVFQELPDCRLLQSFARKASVI